MSIFAFDSALVRKLHQKVRALFNRPVAPLPDGEREDAEIRPEGLEISVETALNSRCVSDRDDNPKIFHWGMFDRKTKLSREQIERIRSLVNVPRFTDGSLKIKAERNKLTFLIDNRAVGCRRDWMMIESGMQQQALGLICASLGVGYVFSGMGADGTPLSTEELATTAVIIDAMKPSYDGQYCTAAAPSGPSPWKEGNLPEPFRKGDKPLLTVLQGLSVKNATGKKASARELAQLLWAARGRTPHFFKSRPWGLTIPTNQGDQTITTVSVIVDGRFSKYVNWKDGRPTHALEGLGSVDGGVMKVLTERFGPGRFFIVLGSNKTTAHALWEVGFELFNLMVQASALGLIYEAVLLGDDKILSGTGIKDPVALFIITNES